MAKISSIYNNRYGQGSALTHFWCNAVCVAAMSGAGSRWSFCSSVNLAFYQLELRDLELGLTIVGENGGTDGGDVTIDAVGEGGDQTVASEFDLGFRRDRSCVGAASTFAAVNPGARTSHPGQQLLAAVLRTATVITAPSDQHFPWRSQVGPRRTAAGAFALA